MTKLVRLIFSKPEKRWGGLISALVAFWLLPGCASDGVASHDVPLTQHGTVRDNGTESQDIIGMSDKMARSILGIPQIANAQGAPRIVVLPIKNNSHFIFDKDMILTRIRVELNSQAAGKVVFLDHCHPMGN